MQLKYICELWMKKVCEFNQIFWCVFVYLWLFILLEYIKRKEKARNEGNNQQLAVCCNNLADFYNQQGKYQNAMREYQQEAELYAKLGKNLEMAKAHRMTGEMYMLLSEFGKAKEHINLYLGECI